MYSPGTRLLIADHVYGNTRVFCETVLLRMGHTDLRDRRLDRSARRVSDVAGLLGFSMWSSILAATARSVSMSTRCRISASASAGAAMKAPCCPPPPAQRAKPWIEDRQFVRFDIGLENPGSFKADLAAALPLFEHRSAAPHAHPYINRFAVGAASFEKGATAIQHTLGIQVPRGGEHDMSGTGSCVMQSGNESFSELIAIGPNAPEHERARWFTLDARAQLAERLRAPCWVVGKPVRRVKPD